MKTITLDNIHAKVRCISFDGKSSDPYVMAHPDGDELSDGRLEELFDEWLKAGNTEPDDSEKFEEFLHYLEDEKGFIYLPVRDEIYEFTSA